MLPFIGEIISVAHSNGGHVAVSEPSTATSWSIGIASVEVGALAFGTSRTKSMAGDSGVCWIVDGECVELWPDGTWNDCDCVDEKVFACEVPFVSSVTSAAIAAKHAGG